VQAAKDQVSALQNAQQPPQEGVSSEELEKVKTELEAKQREIEALKATADAAALIGQAPEDGSKSVAELVQEQVEQISTRLTAEHNQRISDEETKYQKRADSMKTQLSKKLADGKQAIRDQEKVEHDKAVEQLKSEHTAELERLRSEHQEEIKRLKAQGSAIVSAAPAEANGITSETNGIKPAEWAPSPEQIKELLQSNPHVKRIIQGNIEKKTQQQKESWTAQIKQEEEQSWTVKLEETKKAADEAKIKAVELEGSKMKVKLNMLTNKANTAAAQVNYVKKAAEETPQRPVVEVWEQAKSQRAAPAPTSAPTAATPSTTPSVPVPAALQRLPQNNAPPTPSPAPTAPAIPSVSNANVSAFNRSNGPPTRPSQPTPGGFGAPSAPAAVNQQPAPGGFGAPSGPAIVSQQLAPGGFGAPSVPRGTSPFANAGQQPPTGPNTNQQQSNPRGLPQPVGTGPAALKNLLGQNQNQNSALSQPLSSGIPQPRGGHNQRGGARGGYQARGGMQSQQQGFGGQQPQDLNVAGAARGGSNMSRIPGGPGGRGGRGGAGRGQVNTQGGQQGQQGGPNSPGGGRGGSLNPGARQFNPGAGMKRPHEGGEGGNAEKKARGQGE
jgi:nucleoprotein TPR